MVFASQNVKKSQKAQFKSLIVFSKNTTMLKTVVDERDIKNLTQVTKVKTWDGYQCGKCGQEFKTKVGVNF